MLRSSPWSPRPGGTACLDLDTLTVYTDFCTPYLATLIGLLEGEAIDTDALVLAVEEITGVEVTLAGVLGEVVALEDLTRAQLVALADAFGLAVVEDCFPLTFDIGDIVPVLDIGIVCVEITEGGLEVVFDDDALLDEALMAELEALLATLDLEIGDVVCVALIPVDGDFVLGPVVVIVAGDVNVNIGDVVIGDITIGDCSNAVITVIVNGQNVEVDVVRNVEDQCVAVVAGPSPAPARPDTGTPPDDDDDTPAMMRDTAVSDAPLYAGLILALVALVSVGSLGYAKSLARRSR